ncbi:MAG: hypothetical protein FWH55_14600, partial [Oscillospiraceae bacterium]|nr:hypothetical protein [Oscillospiraceae bacterium]
SFAPVPSQMKKILRITNVSLKYRKLWYMIKNRVIIIDGNSLINRAYYGIQRPMITKEGVYTQGVYGFLNMFEKIAKDYPSGYVVVAFDRKAPTFRHEEYEDYKAGRKQMPVELVMQMPLLKDVLDAMKVKRLEIDGYEADDIIGTVAKRAETAGLEPLIITGDKDELQLATDKTKVIITRKGITEFELYDEAAMIEKYGFTPLEFIDYKALMGDSSDNIPGVPGIGEKTAQKLITKFKTVENLYANLDQVESVKLRDKLEQNVGLARLSRRLAEIDTNVPIEIDFDTFTVQEPDMDALISIYVKLEFNSFLRKIKASGRGEVILPERYERLNADASIADAETAKEDAEKAKEILVKINQIKDDYTKKKSQVKALIVSGEGERTAMLSAARNTGITVFAYFQTIII